MVVQGVKMEPTLTAIFRADFRLPRNARLVGGMVMVMQSIAAVCRGPRPAELIEPKMDRCSDLHLCLLRDPRLYSSFASGRPGNFRFFS